MIQTQKVIKVGNSLAMTLDSKQAQLMNIKAGQEMIVVYKPENKVISMARTKNRLNGQATKASERKAVLTSKISPELKQWTDNFLVENQESMKRLADL